MRRLLLTSSAVLSLALAGSGGAIAAETTTDCTDYCAEKAAAHCSDVDSWACSWYIIGCLAGCGIATL